MVGGIGYNPARWPNGEKPTYLDLRLIVTNLAVMDFQGPDNQIRVTSLHPGVTFDQVQDNTGFELACVDNVGETPAPTEEQLQLGTARRDVYTDRLALVATHRCLNRYIGIRQRQQLVIARSVVRRRVDV